MDPDTKADVLVRVFDFGLRKALKDACDQAFFDVRNVYNQSIRDATGRSGFSVVTFIDNHDLNHMGGSIISDPDLAYAYILTNNQIGLPCVFEKDMYGTPSAPNSHVGDEIRALIEAHRRYIFGATEVEYLNRLFSSFTATYTAGLPEDCLIYQLSNSNSGREVVVCINFGQSLLKVEHSLSLANLSIGDTLTDIFGSSAFPISTVSPSGQVYMEVPARSFALWVEGDLRDEIIPIGGGATPLNDPLSDEFMDLQIFPNPVSGPAMITFSMPSHEKVYFSLFDMKGSLAWRTTVEAVPGENRLPFDLPGNREGLFFLKMEGKNFSKYLKVVKK
jgi:alpha-amylase